MSFGIGFGGKIGFAAAGYPKKPTAPTSLTASNSTVGRIDLSWVAPINTGFPAVTSYTVEIVGITTINTGSASTSYSWSGGTKGQSYSFRVYANNSAGQGPASNTTASIAVTGVVATGGSISTYTSGGITYKLHTFTGTSSLNVTNGGTAAVLAVAGGSGGGLSNIGSGGGGGGQVVTNYSVSLTPQQYAATVGAGGVPVGRGGTTTFANITASPGRNGDYYGQGTGGNSGAYADGWTGGERPGDGGTSFGNNNGMAGFLSDVTGTNTYYGGGGGAGRNAGIAGGAGGAGGGGRGSTDSDGGGEKYWPSPVAGTPNTGGGGGGSNGNGNSGGAGGSGIIVVRYIESVA